MREGQTEMSDFARTLKKPSRAEPLRALVYHRAYGIAEYAEPNISTSEVIRQQRASASCGTCVASSPPLEGVQVLLNLLNSQFNKKVRYPRSSGSM